MHILLIATKFDSTYMITRRLNTLTTKVLTFQTMSFHFLKPTSSSWDKPLLSQNLGVGTHPDSSSTNNVNHKYQQCQCMSNFSAYYFNSESNLFSFPRARVPPIGKTKNCRPLFYFQKRKFICPFYFPRNYESFRVHPIVLQVSCQYHSFLLYPIKNKNSSS